MAHDIQKSISANDIKNGSKIVYCSRTGKTETLDNDAVNTPAIEDIQSKYDNNFDDPSYYFGHN